MQKISETGIVGADGKLRLPMDRVNGFLAGHKGERIIAVFYAAGRDATELQQGYFYNYVLPTVQEAFHKLGDRLSEDVVESFLFEQYPGIFRTADGSRAAQGRELNREQMGEFLDWLKQYAAENLDVYIEDPKTL